MFIWVQALRGMAAAIVVCHHYVASQAAQGVPVGNWLLEFGGSGVDIFFVISGFIMTMTQPEGREVGAGRFLARRLARIVPLYWVLTVAAFAMTALPSDIVHARIGFEKFLMSMLFLPYAEAPLDMAADAHRAYVIPMAWTLTYEWLFYLLFAAALALRLPPLARLRFIACAFFVFVATGVLLRPAAPLLQAATSPLLLEFLLGCVVAVLYMHGMRLAGWQATLLAVAAWVALANVFHGSAVTRILCWGPAAGALIAAAVLVGRGCSPENPFIRLLTRLGDISYALYLSHFFTLALFVRMQKHLPPLVDGFSPLALAAFVLLVWNVAALCYRCIEVPARDFLVRREYAMGAVRR